jgi:hypothetical protein
MISMSAKHPSIAPSPLWYGRNCNPLKVLDNAVKLCAEFLQSCHSGRVCIYLMIETANLNDLNCGLIVLFNRDRNTYRDNLTLCDIKKRGKGKERKQSNNSIDTNS